jgi:hypothetical protein
MTKHFTAFLESAVNLNDTRIDILNDRVAAITTFLRGHDVFGQYFLDVMPQGSFAHRTIIKQVGDREYDADVLLALTEHPDWTPAQYTLELRRAFNDSTTYKGMAHMRTRCVYIDYADPFHVDVVPYVESRKCITNNKEGFNGEGGWQLTYPELMTAWLEEKYRATGNRLPAAMRLIKFLRDFKGTFTIKSVILTILVGSVVDETKTLVDDKYYSDIPTVFVRVLEDLNSYLQMNETMPAIMDPVGTGQDFRDRWDQVGYANFRNWIAYYSAKARTAYDADQSSSLGAWQEIFGPDFKEPLVTKALTAAANPAEQFLETSLQIPIRISGKVRLTGRVRGAGVQRAYDLPTRGDRVGKGRTIDLSLSACDVAEPFDVYWKIKNTGAEAAADNGLRGQVQKGEHTRWEHTKYRGSHYAECYIVKDGVCVAIDRQPVIITNR